MFTQSAWATTLKNRDVSDRLKEIKTPTLMLGAKYDTIDPKYME